MHYSHCTSWQSLVANLSIWYTVTETHNAVTVHGASPLSRTALASTRRSNQCGGYLRSPGTSILTRSCFCWRKPILRHRSLWLVCELWVWAPAVSVRDWSNKVGSLILLPIKSIVYIHIYIYIYIYIMMFLLWSWLTLAVCCFHAVLHSCDLLCYKCNLFVSLNAKHRIAEV